MLLVAALLHDIGKGGAAPTTRWPASPWPARSRPGWASPTATSTLVGAPSCAGTCCWPDRHHPRPRRPAPPPSCSPTSPTRPRRSSCCARSPRPTPGRPSPKAWSTWRAGLVDRLVPPGRARARCRVTPVDPAGSTPGPATPYDAARPPSSVEIARTRAAPASPWSRPTGSACSPTSPAVSPLQRVPVRAARAWAQVDAEGEWGVSVWEVAGRRPRRRRRCASGSAAVVEGRVDPPARLRPDGGRSPPIVVVRPDASAPRPCWRSAPPTGPAWSTWCCAALAGLGLTVRSAHVDTLGPQAVDVFYVQEVGGVRPTEERAAEAAHAVRTADWRAPDRRRRSSTAVPDRGAAVRLGRRTRDSELRPWSDHRRRPLTRTTPCSPHSPTASPTPSRTSAARAGSPRPTSTPPRARSASRCSRPTSRCPWSRSSSARSRSGPAARRSAGRSTRPSRSSRSSTRSSSRSSAARPAACATPRPAPTVIMLAGLQGAGKTTLAAKLALWLKDQGKTPDAGRGRPPAPQRRQPAAGQRRARRRPRLRPRARQRRRRPGRRSPRASIEEAKRKLHDVVIVDTAGRLGVDAELMKQAADIRDAVQPDEVLFVVDAMIGQDAVTTAQAFLDGVGFDGVVLTKLDGDARGGAALSIALDHRQAGHVRLHGEKMTDFDLFHPDRMASRILDMGDMLTLIEQAEKTFDEEQAAQGRRRSCRPGRRVHPRRLPRADAADPQARLDVEDHGDAARDGPVPRPARELRRARDRPHPGDHPVDDAGRARQPEDDRRLAPGPHRQGLRPPGLRRQPASSTGSSRPAR